jgi:hypothetical protein
VSSQTRDRRPEPPSGEQPPVTAVTVSGESFDLIPLAQDICRRYHQEFPDERERYGDAGEAWCLHDNQYLLSWAGEAACGFLDMNREVEWLATVLAARGFPLDRLARDLEIGADVVRDQLGPEPAEALAVVLADAAAFVRARVSPPG